MPEIKLSASNQDSEPWRIQRLTCVVNILAILATDATLEMQRTILALSDHKGTLTVEWELDPYEYEKDKLKSIWGLFNEHEIEHKFPLLEPT